MTKKKQEYREWVRLVDFKNVNGILVKGVRYIPPMPVGSRYVPGEEPPKELPLAPRPENTATVASPDEIEAYETGKQDGRKATLETVRDMSSSALKGMRQQRAPHRAELPPAELHTGIA